MRSLFTFLFALLALPGYALTPTVKPLIADISQYNIEINSRFTGANLLLFGARNETGDIVVVVRGPEQSFTVRKKGRIAGIWVNKDQMTFSHIPTYYTVASSKPFIEMRDIFLFTPLRVGVDALLPITPEQRSDKLLPEFQQALLDYQRKRRLFSEGVNEVDFVEDTLFKTHVPFPNNIPGGSYTAEVYLFNEGQLVSMQSIPIQVYTKGFDAFVYNLANHYPIFYGVVAVLIALAAGWGASEVYRKI